MNQPPEHRETEHRRGTVMFADITGFTSLVEQSDDEEAYEAVTSCLRLLDGIARQYGATVDKYLGDCIMAVFGVPTAVEDAPRAAINAAIEMKRAMVGFNERAGLEAPLDLHIGINTGQLISGDVSGPVMREFAVMGDAVNVSARLKDEAPPGEIWVGDETWRCTRHVFEFDEVGTLELKGKKKPVAAWAVRSTASREYKHRSGSRRPVYSELVGRATQLRAARAALAAVREGSGRILSVIGEPGLGKSRLVDELQQGDPAEGVLWLEGRCLSVGRNLSHHPFQDLFRGWLELDGDTPGDAVRERIDTRLGELFGEEGRELAPLLAQLLGAGLSPEERRGLAATRGDALERRVRNAAVRIVSGLADRGAVGLVIDDLHWADGTSLELVEALLPLAATRPILFVNVFRSHYEETGERIRGVCELRHAERYEEVEILPLGESASRRLIDNFFRGGSVPHTTRETIRTRAAGNPLFAEEVVRALIDEGAATVQDGVLVATEAIHRFVIPGSIREVLMARIDSLDRPRRSVLEAAAVMGGTFHAPVLAHVLGKDEVSDVLEGLRDSGLVDTSERGVEGWTFRHPLIQEATYETLLRSRRRELHQAVGEAIEGLLTDNVPGYHAMLAWHFTQAGDPRGEEYIFRAGDEAARAAASSEALHFFQQAVDLFVERHGEKGDPAKRARLEKNLAMALFNRGRLIESIERFDHALEALGDRIPESWPALYLRFGVEMASVLPRLYGWRKGGRPASDLDREIVEMRFQRCLAETTTDPAFVFHTLSALRMILKLDPATVPDSAGYMAGAVGMFSYGGLSFALGQRMLDRSDLYAEAGHTERLGLYAALMHFIHHFLRGDWERARPFPDTLLEEGLALGRLWEFPVALDFDCERALATGDFGRARERIDQLADVAATYDHEYARTAALSLGSFLHLECGDLDRAWEAIEQYRELSGELSYQLVAYGTRARIARLRGDLDEALASIARADEILPHAGLMTPFHLSFVDVPRYRVDLAALEAALGGAGSRSPTELRRRARKSRRRVEALEPKVAPRRTEIWRLRGIHDWILGRHSQALRCFARSLEVGEALGARPELARTCAELARRLDGEAGPNALDGAGGPTELGGLDAGTFRARAVALAAEIGVPPGAVGLP